MVVPLYTMRGTHYNLSVIILVKYCYLLQALFEGSIVFVTADETIGKKTKKDPPKTIAVIGGGVSGSFVTKYLVDYDSKCDKIASITIFEPNPIQDTTLAPNKGEYEPPSPIQGSRVRTVQLQSGEIIEVGASIGYKGYYHVLELLQNDKSIVVTEPFTTGVNKTSHDNIVRDGFGIYDGQQRKKWPVITAGVSANQKKFNFLLRYHWDLYKVTRKLKQFLTEWANLPALLNSIHPSTFYQSPDEIWQAINLYDAVHMSFDKLLDAIGVTKSYTSSTSDSSSSSSSSSWWNTLFPFQGSIRAEILTAINLVNYNQDTAGVNGVTGMASFAASSGGLFSIAGGNYKIIHSAFHQAKTNRETICTSVPIATENPIDPTEQIQIIPKRITTILGNLEGFTVYSDQEIVGQYDIIIVAAPIQQTQITFLIQSHFDEAVIQPMPLGGLVQAHDNEKHDSSAAILPTPLPKIARRPYKQVVTTIVSNANLALDTLSYPTDSTTTTIIPKSVLVTSFGKAALYNITAITYIQEGVYKLFSDSILDVAILQNLFGSNVVIEDITFWGGAHGGATPDYQGQGVASPFLLYDGASGMEGHTTSGALYYPNAMEQSSLASMEIAAIGSKAVAKLIAKRLSMIRPKIDLDVRDEL